ncbi:collectin-12 isoform X5 [Folsomia candida]|nr:collectin-12 isoform X5 [Folsomia candida]
MRIQAFLPQECLQTNNNNEPNNTKRQFPSLSTFGLRRCPIGPSGEVGERGEQGIRGSPGKPGIDGPNGLNGRDGRDGEQGPRGPTGAKGCPGAKGLKGVQGPSGLPGMPGRPGRDGRDEIPRIYDMNTAQRPVSDFSTSEESTGTKPNSIPFLGQCDRFDLQPVKKTPTTLITSSVNIFICNSANVDVNVAMNSSSSSNIQDDNNYKLVPHKQKY